MKPFYAIITATTVAWLLKVGLASSTCPSGQCSSDDDCGQVNKFCNIATGSSCGTCDGCTGCPFVIPAGRVCQRFGFQNSCGRVGCAQGCNDNNDCTAPKTCSAASFSCSGTCGCLVGTCTDSSECTAGKVCSGLCGACESQDASGGQDPHMHGFDRKPFEFPGVPGGHFSLISSNTTQLNTRIGDLGRTDGSTYMTSIGALIAPNVTIGIHTPPHCNGTDLPFTVELGDEPIEAGQAKTIKTPQGLVTVDNRKSTANGFKLVSITTLELLLNVTRNVDSCFLDMAVTYLKPTNADEVDGVLGQTLRCAKNPSAPCPINGDEATWMVSDLFAYDAPTNKFDPNAKAARRSLMEVDQVVVLMTVAGGKRGLSLTVGDA